MRQATLSPTPAGVLQPRRRPWSSFGMPTVRFHRTASLALILTASAAAISLVLLSDMDASAIWAWDIAIVSLLALQARAFHASRPYLFTASFWTALFFAFYWVLKSTELVEGDTRWIEMALMHGALFLLFYTAGSLVDGNRRHTRPMLAVVGTDRLALLCFAIFLASRAGYHVAVAAVLGGQYNQLELLAGTQNLGMAYVFKAFSIGHLALLMLLASAFVERRHVGYAVVATAIYVMDALLTASRGGLIALILTLVFLYGRHVKRVSWLWLALLAPVLIFVVSFFGYVREIELGSWAVYRDAVTVFLDDAGLVWTLFLGRLDVLPMVAGALEANAAGRLDGLNGSSYLDMFLHFIPRSLWPDKPPLTAAYVTAGVAPGIYDAGVLVYPTVMLEGYLNASTIGVAVAGMLTGLLAARYDRWMQDRSLGSTFLSVAFFTFPMGLVAEGFHSNYVASTLYTAALALILIGVLRWSGALASIGSRRRPAAGSVAPVTAR